MLISHSKKFIYTKTFKTAGTSVELYFEPWCMPEGEWKFDHHRKEYQSDAGIIGFRGRGRNRRHKTWYGQMPAKQIRDQIGQTTWDSYFKFCVVRDPFDTLISAFHWKNQQRSRHPSEWVHAWIRKMRDKRTPFDQIEGNTDIERFRSWIAAGGGRGLSRSKYMIDGEVCVDYFIRYEQLADGIQHVCDVLGIPFRPENISTLKAGVRPARTIRDYYDEKTIDRVLELYEPEIRMFGYKPPS